MLVGLKDNILYWININMKPLHKRFLLCTAILLLATLVRALAQDLTEVRYEMPYSNAVQLLSFMYRQPGNLVWLETTNSVGLRCGGITLQGLGVAKNTVQVDVTCDDFMHGVIQGLLVKEWSDYTKTNDKLATVAAYTALTKSLTVVKTNVVSVDAVAKKAPPPIKTVEEK